MTTLFPLRNLRRVYCAGPLFNAAERREMLHIAEVLAAAGFEPFVPHADGMEFAQLQPFLVARGFESREIGQLLHSAIFALDTYQVVVECGSLVFNMNGRVPDEGAVAEATMAWMLGKPIVLFKEDARSAIVGRDNPLVIGPGCFQTVADIDRLGEELAAQIARHELDASWQATCPPHLESTLQAGQRLWQALEDLDGNRDLEPVARVVLELFAPEKGVRNHFHGKTHVGTA
jgi:nucleoside 2-deoxyribosyltransferase